MGMAASQARYLALTARKTNVEYEGQQINQSRTALANQSANLFNQMLDMEVPTPPSTADYTTIQYSYSDGANTEVLSNYYQLGTADSDYNYVVTTYHNESVYTGSRKKLNDPQVQATTTHHYSYTPGVGDNNNSKTVTKAEFNEAEGTYLIQTTDGTTSVFRPTATAEEDQVKAINYGNDVFKTDTVDMSDTSDRLKFIPVGYETNTVTKANKADFKPVGVTSTTIAAGTVNPDSWSAATDDVTTRAAISKLFGVEADDIDISQYSYCAYDGSYVNKAKSDIVSDTALEDVRKEGSVSDADKAAIKKLYGLTTDPAVGDYFKNDAGEYIARSEYIALDDDISATSRKDTEVAITDEEEDVIRKLFELDESTAINAGDYAKTSDGGYISKADYQGTAEVDARYNEGKGITDPATIYTDGKSYIQKTDLDSAVEIYKKYEDTGKKEVNTVNYLSVSDDPEFSNYTAVGNCALTQMTESDMAKEDIAAEIDQIIKDMKKSGGDPVAAENLAACFDEEGNYTGGIYQFQMGGTTYYTTKNDLDTSLGTSIVDNGIDVQQDKLRYYNAIYQDTKVEETQKALLETDGQGRFSSVKLENDSVKYTLNTETVTDEDAYNDAMNRYYYEQATYEKAISDINAKTEVIQAQDRTLELRLEQLNTEQSALQNEMEAVKKVVDKHVELGFKTFGG